MAMGTYKKNIIGQSNVDTFSELTAHQSQGTPGNARSYPEAL